MAHFLGSLLRNRSPASRRSVSGNWRSKTSAARQVFWSRLWPLLVAAAALSPLTASAQLAAITTQPVNMRAGPERDFPLVAWLPAGTPVSVVGCIDNWHWCDIVSGFNRGWVYAGFLSMAYRNQPTVILNYGAILGVPLIGFSVNSYWNSYYRNRPWWNNRSYWAGRPPTWQHPPPRPPAVRPPPPRPAPRPPTIQPVPSPGQPGGRPPSSGKPPPSGGRPPPTGNPPPSTDRPPSGGRTPSNSRPPSGGNPPRDGNAPPGPGSG